MLQGDLVYLRPLERKDFDAIIRWSVDEEVKQLVDGGVPESLEECEEWYLSAKSDRYHQIMAIVAHDGTLIGDIELNHITWRNGHAEMRIRIGERNYWDKGYGTDAVRCMVRYVFEHLRLNRLYLRVYSFNARAVACYQKAGFKKEGILKRGSADPENWKEIILMRILREEYLRRREREGVPARRASRAV